MYKYKGKFSRHYAALPWARVVVSSATIAERLRGEGVDAKFVPKGYNQELLRNLDQDRSIKLGFVGNIEHDTYQKRKELLQHACDSLGFSIKKTNSGEDYLKALSNNKVFIIDACDIEQTNSALCDERSIENMALLYAQLPVTCDVIAYPLLKESLILANEQVVDEKEWQQGLIKQRRWWQKKFIDKKVFRDCTAFICKSNYSRFLVAKRGIYTDEMAQALSNPDALIENGYLLKSGNTATVARVEIAGKTYVLKRYKIKKRVHSILRGLRWSRAAVSWLNGLLLEMLGIPTAKSYAYALIEERWGGNETSFLYIV